MLMLRASKEEKEEEIRERTERKLFIWLCQTALVQREA
jgi:hypothetical protein